MNAYQCVWCNTGSRPGLAGPLAMDGVWSPVCGVPEQFSGLPVVGVQMRERKGCSQTRPKIAANRANSRELLRRHKLSSTQDVTSSLTP